MVDAQLRRLAARASTIIERATGPYHARSSPRFEQRLARWQRVLGGEEALDHRLSLAGASRDDLPLLLGDPVLDDGAPLPGWVATLESCLHAVEEGRGAPIHESRWPFGHILAPIASVASVTLTEAHPNAPIDGLLDRLMSDLLLVHGRALQRAFVSFRTVRSHGLVRSGGASQLYEAFIDHLRDGGLRTAYERQPMLARLSGRSVERFVAATSEMLHRLDTDLSALDGGAVRALIASSSDGHDGGRHVVTVELEDRRVVYKPRELGIDAAFFDLLAWLNDRGALPSLETIRIVPRAGYGWMDAVDRAAPPRGAAYHTNAGALLAILYGIGASDCHRDNIIPRPDQPVLVDLETALAPMRSAGATDAEAAAVDAFRRSVLNTGLLPNARDVGGTDVSGLSVGGPIELSGDDPVWLDINTDEMRLAARPTASAAITSRSTRWPHAQTDGVIGGFVRAHRLLRANADEVLERGPLAEFSDTKARFVVRDTAVYSMVREKSLSPESLRDGADFSIELEWLCRPDPARPLPWSMVPAELTALTDLDIPRFVVRADRCDLETSRGEVVAEAMFTRSPLEVARTNLRSMDEEDGEWQVALIRTAVTMNEVESAEPRSFGAAADGAGDDVMQAVLRIAGTLSSRAIHAAGACTWLSVSLGPSGYSPVILPIGPALYSGRAGVAMFFAALFAAAAREQDAAMARASLSGLAEIAANSEGQHRGVAFGPLSVAYAYSCVGEQLADTSYLDVAVDLAKRYADGAPDGICDVFAGDAGTILVLLHLHDRTGDATLLERADGLASRLLERRVGAAGKRVWPSALGTPPLVGFGHGQAGIAYALTRLARCVGTPALVDAAREALEYEHLHFDGRDWADLSSGTAAPATINAWCNGATGVAMARLAMGDVLETDDVRRDVDAAVALARADAPDGLDDLCCGVAAQLELLVSASDDQADVFARALAGRAAVAPRLRGHGVPGLFVGLAGIGYGLLRSTARDTTRSVFLFE